MARLLLVLGALVLLFYLLVRLVPEGFLLPLYCLFTIAGMAFALRERRKIGARRGALQRQLDHERLRGHASSLPWGEEDE